MEDEEFLALQPAAMTVSALADALRQRGGLDRVGPNPRKGDYVTELRKMQDELSAARAAKKRPAPGDVKTPARKARKSVGPEKKEAPKTPSLFDLPDPEKTRRTPRKTAVKAKKDEEKEEEEKKDAPSDEEAEPPKGKTPRKGKRAAPEEKEAEEKMKDAEEADEEKEEAEPAAKKGRGRTPAKAAAAPRRTSTKNVFQSPTPAKAKKLLVISTEAPQGAEIRIVQGEKAQEQREPAAVEVAERTRSGVAWASSPAKISPAEPAPSAPAVALPLMQRLAESSPMQFIRRLSRSTMTLPPIQEAPAVPVRAAIPPPAPAPAEARPASQIAIGRWLLGAFLVVGTLGFIGACYWMGAATIMYGASGLFQYPLVHFCPSAAEKPYSCLACPESAKCNDRTFTCNEGFIRHGLRCVKDEELYALADEAGAEAVRILQRRRGDFECKFAESAELTEKELVMVLSERLSTDMDEARKALAMALKKTVPGLAVSGALYSAKVGVKSWDCSLKEMLEALNVFGKCRAFAAEHGLWAAAGIAVAVVLLIAAAALKRAYTEKHLSERIFVQICDALQANARQHPAKPWIAEAHLAAQFQVSPHIWQKVGDLVSRDSRILVTVRLVDQVAQTTWQWSAPALQ